MKNILKSWIIFNVFISLYEIYIIKTRNVIKEKYCLKNFWTTQVKFRNITRLQAYWNEYACKVDARYFDYNNYVYLFEAINVVSTILLIIFYYYGLKSWMMMSLFLQMANCCVYFYTIPAQKYDYIDILYLAISSAWVLVPLYILYDFYANK